MSTSDFFGYFVSHDLRAPLRAIDGYARVIARALETPQATQGEDISTALNAIVANCHKMNVLIDDVLEFSSYERAEIARVRVDMKTLVDAEVAELFQLGVADRAHDHIIVEPLDAVDADEKMLRVVWRNLLDNACKYSAGGAGRQIFIRSAKVKDGVQYTIQDNGIGFLPEKAESLFLPFERGHSDKEYHGSGIGLALCNTIIARHGGQIWAKSDGSGGACFGFTLPTDFNAS